MTINNSTIIDAIIDDWDKNGKRWWAEYLADQMLSLLASLPAKDVGQLLSMLGIPLLSVEFVGSEPIVLPILSSESSRMSPVDGFGFAEQHIHAYPRPIQ